MAIYPYAILPAIPTSQATVCWIDTNNVGNDMHLWYGHESVLADKTQLPGDNHWIYTAKISGLERNTKYSAEIREGESVISSVSFKTFPSMLSTELKIVHVSDLHIDDSNGMNNANEMDVIASNNPDALLISGDSFTYATEVSTTNRDKWIGFFSNYISKLNTSKEHLVPILHAPGNHEVGNHTWTGTGSVTPSAGLFQSFFDNPKNLNPVGENYGQITFGNYLQVIALDTHSALPGTVGSWLADNVSSSIPVCIPFYHSPMLPGGEREANDLTLQESLRSAWAKIFSDSESIKFTLCGHIHLRKRSVPYQVVGTDPGGNNFDLGDGNYLKESAGGTIEIGDGYRSDRSTWSQWYLAATGTGKQYKLITIGPGNIKLEAKDTADTSFYTQNWNFSYPYIDISGRTIKKILSGGVERYIREVR